MTIDDAIAERVVARLDLPALVERIAARVAEKMRAGDGEEWRSPSAHARHYGASVDTVTRQIARGELDVQELSRVALRGPDGEQLRARDGQPRWRRTLRVRLPQRASEAQIAEMSAEARR